jgi:hypothetical protein
VKTTLKSNELYHSLMYHDLLFSIVSLGQVLLLSILRSLYRSKCLPPFLYPIRDTVHVPVPGKIRSNTVPVSSIYRSEILNSIMHVY